MKLVKQGKPRHQERVQLGKRATNFIVIVLEGIAEAPWQVEDAVIQIVFIVLDVFIHESPGVEALFDAFAGAANTVHTSAAAGMLKPMALHLHNLGIARIMCNLEAPGCLKYADQAQCGQAAHVNHDIPSRYTWKE